MNTERTITEIELAVAKYFGIRENTIVPNVSWGFLNHEADLIVMSKSGYLTEIEIKRSLSDLKADFKKTHTHDDNTDYINYSLGSRLSYLYYCVPENMLNDTKRLLNENDRLVSGILTYSEKLEIRRESYSYKGFDVSCKNLGGRKLFLEEQLQIMRLGCMRIWGLKQKLININDGAK